MRVSFYRYSDRQCFGERCKQASVKLATRRAISCSGWGNSIRPLLPSIRQAVLFSTQGTKWASRGKRGRVEGISVREVFRRPLENTSLLVLS